METAKQNKQELSRKDQTVLLGARIPRWIRDRLWAERGRTGQPMAEQITEALTKHFESSCSSR